ncbi:MAG: WD40 repeat domain-containing protein [Microcystaceae cyanobacterium]
MAENLEVGWVRKISFSPDGIYLATASYKMAKLVEVATGREIATIQHQDEVYHVTFSPDGRYFATASGDDTAKLVEVATGREIATIQHQDDVHHVIFSPDGRYFATASDDHTAKLINLQKLSRLLNKAKNRTTSQKTETSAIVYLDKPEAFFLNWLRLESNQSSFYEYMLKEAKQQKEGLSVKYRYPILETNLLLQSLGFLFLNAERHYQTVYPTLIDIDDAEIQSIAMQDMKQSISAALSSLYEFIASRMTLDNEDYDQGIKRFKQDIEQEITNTELLIEIEHQLQILLQLKGINNQEELRTIKEMLIEIEKIFKSLLPEEMREEQSENSVIAIKEDLDKQQIGNLANETPENQIIPLLSNLKELGLLNSAIALACLKKLSPKELIEGCQVLPQKAINKELALTIINKRQKTHYIGTLLPWTDFTNKEVLLNILQTTPLKRCWLR